MTGIYKIQSKVKSERCYIGSTVNISKRWGSHLFELNRNKHPNQRLQNHYNKYGKNDLQFSILICCDKINLIENEQFFIDSYNPFFNIFKIAGKGIIGHGVTEETKRKIGNAHKGKIISKESREKMRLSHLGSRRSEETRQKMRESNKRVAMLRSEKMKGEGNQFYGKHHTEESKQKIREKAIGRYNKEKNPFYGKHHTQETKDKMKEVWRFRKINEIFSN